MHSTQHAAFLREFCPKIYARGPEKTFYSDIKVGLKQQPDLAFVMTGLQGLSIDLHICAYNMLNWPKKITIYGIYLICFIVITIESLI